MFAYTRDRDPAHGSCSSAAAGVPSPVDTTWSGPRWTTSRDSPLPEGLVVRAVAEAERRTVWEAARDAFRDHRDEQEWTEADWATFQGDFPDVTPWVIAFDGDAVAGGIWNRIDPVANAHHGWDRGVLQTVWTGARWRRRGLAKALIARSLVTLRELGMTSGCARVDGANPNQAMDLYLAQGFEISDSSTDWRKPLPEATDASTTGVSVMPASTRTTDTASRPGWPASA